MNKILSSLSTLTFGGRRFRKFQIAEIQKTVQTFSALSRRELAHTICEHMNWVTPRGTDKIQTCLNALEEMEACGILQLPPKLIRKKKAQQREINHTDRTNASSLIKCPLAELMPITLQVVSDKEQVEEWNEFVDRYHYLGYRRLIGSHLRYYMVDRYGRKLGCLSFSFASTTLLCRDEWIGWTEQHRQKHLNLVINNNRFLIFPWVAVEHLASKILAYAVRQVGDDWETTHGYKPVLVETFVDPSKYKGTCYKASNWQYIGNTTGRLLKKNGTQSVPKEIYLYPLDPDARETLMDNKKSPSKKVDAYKTANIPPDNQVHLWQKIIVIVAAIAENFDKTWQKRQRVISTLLIILFIFRLVFSKNKQGYGSTITELWEYCDKLNIPLPQSKPVAASAFCNARKKLDESIFKTLNTEIIRTYEAHQDHYRWKNHRLFAVDGSKVNLPKQLIKSSYKTPSANAHYPQGLLSCLYQLKSKIPFDFELSPHGDERKLAIGHLDVLEQGDVVVYDRGYCSYNMLLTHHQKEIHAVFRLAKNTFKVIDDFMLSAETERLIVINPDVESRKKLRQKHPGINIIPLHFRLIKYTIEDITYTIGTTLLDMEQYKTAEFPDIYHARWGIEELYKISKTLIDVEDFHGQSERGVKQELYAHFVIITLSRIFSNQTDDVLLLNQISDDDKKINTNFKNCLITVARNIEGLFLQQVQYIKDTLLVINKAISTCFQKERPNRTYQRRSHKVIKKWRQPRPKKTCSANLLPIVA